MKTIKAILWRNINKATHDTLNAISDGQYDIRLGSAELSTFFEGLPKENETALGGYDIIIPIEPFSNAENTDLSCEAFNLKVRFMGNQSVRKDWYIQSQRPETAYPLWKPGRRLPHATSTRSFIYIVKTEDDKYHARLMLNSEIDNSPDKIKNLFLSKDTGMEVLDINNYSEESKKIYKKLMQKKNVLLYGPPGTGKTVLMQQVVEIFKNGGYGISFNETEEITPFIPQVKLDNSKTVWTTFHQSYSYEEFIIGLSTENDGDKLLNIKPRPGILLELAEFARENGNRSLLVIDELNRGNVSRIFGEFITLIEPDKRLDENGNKTVSTVEIRIPHINYGEEISINTGEGEFKCRNPFLMPKEVYTLASMNSIDKSIFPLDSALRRRFYRYELMPDLELLASKLQIDLNDVSLPVSNDLSLISVEDVRKLAWYFLKYLNRKIELFLGEDFTLGHSYMWGLHDQFCNTNEAIKHLCEILFEQILPQLEELFRGRSDQLQHILKINELEESCPFNIVEPIEDESDLGATISLSYNKIDFKYENAFKWFKYVSEIPIVDNQENLILNR